MEAGNEAGRKAGMGWKVRRGQERDVGVRGRGRVDEKERSRGGSDRLEKESKEG